MAEQPVIYRGLRLVDAAAMLACAALLLPAAETARADAGARLSQTVGTAEVTAAPATEPSAGAGVLAWQQPGGNGVLRRTGAQLALPGRDPVVAGNEVAWRVGDQVSFAPVASLAATGAEPAPGADYFGFSARWLVWRAPRGDGGWLLQVRERGRPDLPVRTLESVPGRAQIGRPVVDGDRVVYHLAGSNGSRIVLRELATGAGRVLRRTRRSLLMNPTLVGDTLLHVASTSRIQEVLLGPLDGDDRPLYATTPTARRDTGREPGNGRHRHYRFIRGRYRAVAPPRLAPRPPRGVTVTLWTTALDPGFAYVTRLALRDRTTTAALLRIAR